MQPRGLEGADDVAIAAAKVLLRKAVLLRRDLRPAAERQAADADRFELLREHVTTKAPKTVAAYLSSGSEPGTLQLVAWLAAHDILVLLPVLTGPGGGPMGEAAWAPYAGAEAVRVGYHSILEPTTPAEPAGALARADLVICPRWPPTSPGTGWVAAGWYDRALAKASGNAGLWVLLNDDEVLDAIPTHPWDRRMTSVVTPGGVVDCQPGSFGRGEHPKS